MTSPKLRLAFAGTPELAATVLQRILKDENNYSVVNVYTQPDRRAGRGRKLLPSPVKILAEKHHIPVKQPERPEDIDISSELAELDALIVAAYGMILPEDVLTGPRLGCINVHTSLLPRWRGAAPIQRAIQAGDNETGITIMRMDAGLDTGNILLQKSCAIHEDDTSGILHDRLAILGGETLLQALEGLTKGTLQGEKQNNSQATYAKKITKEEAQIDWSLPAQQIQQNIRAFNPTPVAHSELNNIRIRIWEASVLEIQTRDYTPGTIISCSTEGIDIATADLVLRILKLQLPGKKVITAKDFSNSHPDFLTNE